MRWQDLENHVRTIAAFLYDAPAKAETVNGVKCDCVVRKRPDYWVVVEVSKESTLSKLRIDLGKFSAIRPFLFSKQIYVECVFICQDPPPSLIETGAGQNVEVLSPDTFGGKLLDFDRYQHVRSSRAFGSAIDPFSGKKDEREYIAVHYQGVTVKDKEYSLEDIVRLLRQRKRVILLGNYGTGKSRCVQELFGLMKTDRSLASYVLSIDLRDNWGVRRATELVRRHFDDLGLSSSSENAIKILPSANMTYLVDGFDEIGSQTWSDDPLMLRNIRKKSLDAVRDLAAMTEGGILVTGREHYFNSNQEMFDCLGMSPESTVVIRCREEFTDEEITAYLRDLTSGEEHTVPSWLPKRPLVCQILSQLSPTTRQDVFLGNQGEVGFWETLLNAICEREAKINPVLDAAVVRSVLVLLARQSRVKPGNIGPISIAEINQSFERIAGLPPADESAAILQRLPILGRIGPESTDRQFVDSYFLDGLRAVDINHAVYSQDDDLVDEPWINALQAFGLRVVRAEIDASPSQAGFVQFMRRAALKQNRVLAGEIASALLDSNNGDFDFCDLRISDAHIANLNLSDSSARKLTIDQSIIDRLDITNARVVDLTIRNSLIRMVEGVSDAKGLPEWLSDGNDVEEYRRLSTLSRIKSTPLTTHQRILVAMIKKTFFQPGAGRKEAALTRGLDQSIERKAVKKILNTLVEQGILTRTKGKEGNIYVPNRKHTKRMEEILTQLTLSQDALWTSLPKT